MEAEATEEKQGCLYLSMLAAVCQLAFLFELVCQLAVVRVRALRPESTIAY
jgi:hypothetical protein